MFFGGIKSPCGNGGTHSLGFPYKIGVFSYGKTQGRVLGGGRSPCGKHADSHPGFGQGPVSNPASPGRTGLEPGLTRVRRPCASPLGNLTTVGRPRARPLGNLTTVGHLAEVSPDLGPHFQTQKHFFDVIFNDGKSSFLTHDRALGVIMGGNESHGRPASF